MSFLQIIKKTTLVLLLSVATISNAETNDTVMCPSLDKIHQSAPLINDAKHEWNRMTFMAGTRETIFQESNLYWSLGVPVRADSEEEAIVKAQKIVAEVLVMGAQTASKMGKFAYSCTYYASVNNSMGLVFAIGHKMPSKISLSTFNKLK